MLNTYFFVSFVGQKFNFWASIMIRFNMSNLSRTRLFLFLLVTSTISLQLKAEEGMWLPVQIEEVISLYKEQYPTLMAEQLYHPTKISASKAIVSLGDFCTAEFISDKGLLMKMNSTQLFYPDANNMMCISIGKINEKGELISLAFDGNKEGLLSDVYFDDEVTRSINADIRFILFIIDQLSGATHIIDELDIVDLQPTN